MSLSLLRSLEQGEFEAAFFLTYTLNLRFFEEMVLPRLRRLGVVRIGILTDEKGYQDSLDDPLGQSWCGRAYVVAPARLPGGGIQHAKLLWLQGRQQVAFVGSHNLTMAGFNDQAELTVRLSSDNAGHVQALRDLHAAVSRLVPPSLKPFWRHTGPPAAVDSPPSARLLTNLDRPLSDQLIELVGTARQLRVLTPFLSASSLDRLARGVRAHRVTLDVPREGADTPLADVAGPLRTLQHLIDKRRLHAKAYEFRTSGGSWLAIGSANCTEAALERTVADGGNCEFLAVLPDAVLPVDGMAFAEVSDPADFPGTGRDFSAGRSVSRRLMIETAEYGDGRLSVRWAWAGEHGPTSVTIRVSDLEVACSSKPCVVELPTTPGLVMLQTTVDGQQHTARAWVAVPELLEAQVASRARQRWEGHLVSDDPTIQAEGIAALLDRILRDLSRGDDEETAASGSVRPHTESHREESRRFRSALEVFQFSADSDRIRLMAASLLGSPSLDPLAVLRALIARMASVAPLALQADVNGLDHYERLRHAATRRLGESLARHFELLASRDRDWAQTTEPKIAACLEGTFGATTLIWHCEVGREASVQLRTRLAEGFIALLERVSAARQAAPHLRELRIAGPLALSLGAMAQAASDDPFLTDRLRRLGRAVLGDDPRPTLRDWRATCQRQAAVLLSSSQDGDPRSRWEPHALRLFGFAPGHVKNRLEQQWTLLLELQEADRANSSRREDLYRAAEARYQGSAIWARYLSARRGGRLPAISLVSRPQCDRCFASLPSQKARLWSRGEAVLCDCGRILLLRS